MVWWFVFLQSKAVEEAIYARRSRAHVNLGLFPPSRPPQLQPGPRPSEIVDDLFDRIFPFSPEHIGHSIDFELQQQLDQRNLESLPSIR